MRNVMKFGHIRPIKILSVKIVYIVYNTAITVVIFCYLIQYFNKLL